MSFFVEAGGQGVSRGGKGIMLAGLRRIGWAKGGVGGRANVSGYNPKKDLQMRMQADAMRGRRSGSGAGKGPGGGSQPAHLHGRSSFQGANTITGNPNNRWVRGGQAQRTNGMPRPRGFINFK